MRRRLFAFAAAAAVLASGAVSAETRPFVAKDMIMMDRVSDPHLSPDGKFVAYDLRTTDLAANKGLHAIWVKGLGDGAPARRLAISDKGATNPRWSPDGKLYFLSSRSGSQQVWRTDAAGTEAVQVTSLPLDVGTFRVSPDGKKIAVALTVFPDCPDLNCTVERNAKHEKGRPSGEVFTKLFVRHWDEWEDGSRNHLFLLDLGADGKASGAPVELTRGVDADVPGKPFGDEGDFVFTPDGKSIIYSARIAGRTEPWSTNFDLFEAPADGSGAPKNLTPDNAAEDVNPVVSPDGKWLAWRAMTRPTFEADRFGVWVMDLATGAKHEIDPSWDRSADSLAWSSDGKSLLLTAEDVGQTRLFRMDPQTGKVTPMTGPGHVPGFDEAKGTVVYAADNLSSPAQLFEVPLAAPAHASRAKGGEALPGPKIQLTNHNAERLAGLSFGAYEQFEFPGWNGETVHGYIVKPAGYVEGKKYPVAFLIHGGPQGSFGNLFHYRWNAETYSGAGYAVVMIDFHGSTGYGQAFTDAISRHWGDRPLEDLQKGWAFALQKYAFLDGDRACALGGSYGGFMVDWIAGNWSKPWKCLVSHDGVFDARMMGYSTEELWFEEWEQGGTPWAVPGNYEQFNPINHVADWSKPMLIVHSQKDYRIPVEQGLGAFGALQRKGVPSEFLYFPDENHWVLKPQNSIQWHETVEAWLNKWTAPN